MSPVLLEPTFNGRPIRANSREAVAHYGILAERATAGRDALDPAVADGSTSGGRPLRAGRGGRRR